MKHSVKIIGSMLLAATVTTSCVDDDKLQFAFEKPMDIAGMEYLADYDALKTYVDRSANPNFKLGVALAASDYNANGVVTRLANSNFDEMTAGNAMKYASCVADNGAMNFGTVESFVANAKANNMTIYGHTLAWHSQQNNKYLNSLIKDREIKVDPNAKIEKQDYYGDFKGVTKFPYYVMGYEPTIVNDCLHSEYPGSWYQYFIADNVALPEGDYTAIIKVKSDRAGSLTLNMGWGWGSGEQAGGKLAVSEDWQESVVNFTKLTDKAVNLVLQPGGFEGPIDIEWIKIVHYEAPVMEFYSNVLSNSKMESGQPMTNFVVREKGKGDVPGPILEGQGPDGLNCTKITAIANPANAWDTQFFITSDKAWAGGEKYRISFWYKASEAAASESQCHGAPGAYMHWQMLPGNPSFTTEWQHYEAVSTIPSEGNGMKSIAFNLNVSKNAVTYYFADIVWEEVKSGNTIPLTPQEKKDTLTWAMDNWIGGMMKATGGYVTSWDVVNEPLSGADVDGDGFYDLQSATRGTVPAEEAPNNFYWQDYLGDLDYVRTAVAQARKHFAENGGNAADLKLFINDYNLESTWDNNHKMKSMAEWIKRWEADGVTKIDGIGSQMHVSYNENPDAQKKQEECVVNMFKLMAATGKLVKVSELDMGYIDAENNVVTKDDISIAQLEEMRQFYRFIVRSYFENIPAAQRYGITQWCITDAPSDSGWRKSEPVGLWTLDYARKPAYAGFAEGLQGK